MSQPPAHVPASAPVAPVVPAVEAVVFDFGGVLITPITRTLGAIAADLGVDTAVAAAIFMGPFEATTDHPWHRLEVGALAVADLQAACGPYAAERGVQLRGDEVARLLGPGAFDVNHHVLDAIARVRAAGYRTAMLTNSIREFRPTLEATIPFSLFDAVVDSSEVGHRKPDPAVFRLTMTALAVEDPSRIVFLDDFAPNLAGAAAVGWRTIHVVDPTVALGELAAVLGVDLLPG